MNKILFKLTAMLPCRLIERTPGEKYLERYYVGQLLGWTFYLHRFVSRDGDLHVHNHPWSTGFAAVLAGKYDEEVATDVCPHAGPSGCVTARRAVKWLNRVDGNRFHRILRVDPGTWTLFAHGPRPKLRGATKGWGFMAREGSTTVYTPFTSSPSATWWLTAPKGRDAGRAPL